MKISHYYILRADNLVALQNDVNEMNTKGYQPIGGVAIVPRYMNDDNLNDDVCWVQAMGLPVE